MRNLDAGTTALRTATEKRWVRKTRTSCSAWCSGAKTCPAQGFVLFLETSDVGLLEYIAKFSLHIMTHIPASGSVRADNQGCNACIRIRRIDHSTPPPWRKSSPLINTRSSPVYGSFSVKPRSRSRPLQGTMATLASVHNALACQSATPIQIHVCSFGGSIFAF